MGGDDTITGNGNTRVSYQRATAGVTVDLTAGTAKGTATNADGTNDLASVGRDTITGGVNAARGSAFDDVLLGTSGGDNLDGIGGNDILDGLGGIDSVRYDFTNLTGLGIAVNMAAGTVVGRDAAATAAFGSDTLRSIEFVRGTNVADIYDATAFSGTSTNAGSNGTANQFEGRGGDDLITGNGFTTLAFGSASAAVTVDFDHGDAHGRAAGDLAGVGTDTFTGVSAVILSNFDDLLITSAGVNGSGGNGVDTVDFSGAAGAVNFNLGSGALTVSPSATGFNLSGFENAIGVAFNDTLTGSAVANVIDGGAGNDVIIGNGGNDTLSGGSGVDVASYFGGAFANYTVADVGAGTLTVTALSGTDGVDTLTGFKFLRFSDGFRLLQPTLDATGVTFDNKIWGTVGDDNLTLGLNASNRVIDMQGGSDTLTFANSSNTSFISGVTVINAETVIGSAKGDTITIGNDSVVTTATGGGGNDTLFASTGEDHFRFVVASDSSAFVLGNGSRDTINNFTAGSDKFVFDHVAEFTSPGSFSYNGTAAFTNTGHVQAHLANIAGVSTLEVDVNGDGVIGAADMQVALNGLNGTLTNADFLIL